MPTDQNNMNAFLEWLKGAPEALAKVVDVLNEFAKLQGEDIKLSPPGPADGPPARREIGDKVTLTTVPLTDQQIKEISDGFADQIVKDKAVEFVKGFITGLTVSA